MSFPSFPGGTSFTRINWVVLVEEKVRKTSSRLESSPSPTSSKVQFQQRWEIGLTVLLEEGKGDSRSPHLRKVEYRGVISLRKGVCDYVPGSTPNVFLVFRFLNLPFLHVLFGVTSGTDAGSSNLPHWYIT